MKWKFQAGIMAVALAAVGQVQATTLAQYDFDKRTNSNTAFADISGNGHTATVVGGVSSLNVDDPFNASTNTGYWVEGKSWQLPGSMFATITNVGSINLQSSGSLLTLEGWVKPVSSDPGTLVEIGNAGLGAYYTLGINGGKAWGRIYESGSGGYTNSTTVLPLNTWTHLALVYDGATEYLYVNGALEVSRPIGLTLPTSLDFGYIGAAGLGQFVNGTRIDDVRISNVDLAPTQLGYFNSFTIPEPGTAAMVGLGLLMVMRRRMR